MSNIDTIIEERPANIGDFLVGRLLPSQRRRNLRPFGFIKDSKSTRGLEKQCF